MWAPGRRAVRPFIVIGLLLALGLGVYFLVPRGDTPENNPPGTSADQSSDLPASLEKTAKETKELDLSEIQEKLASSPDAISLARKLLFGDSHPREKIEVIKVLEGLGTPEAIALLREYAAAESDPSQVWIRKNALAALLRLKSPPAREAVDALKESGPPWVASTVETLKRIERGGGEVPSGSIAPVSGGISETTSGSTRLDQAKTGDISYLSEVAFHSDDSTARRQALQKMSGIPKGQPVLREYVEKNLVDEKRTWEVNTALKELIIEAGANSDSPVFSWIASCDETLCSRIVNVASRLKGPGPKAVLEALRDAFSKEHMIRMRAEKSLRGLED